MRILLVDWLGRGGIAQTSTAWHDVLVGEGFDVRVVSRANLEVPTADGGVDRPHFGGAAAWHFRLVRTAAEFMRTWRPDVVVLQNYLVPAIELPLMAQAKMAGVRSLFVLHNAQHHDRRSGSDVGRRHMTKLADEVVCHSQFVAGTVERSTTVIPLPRLDVITCAGESLDEGRQSPGQPPVLLQFGVFSRAYKGMETTVALSLAADLGWRVRLVGNGLIPDEFPPELEVRSGYLSPADLAVEIRRASAVALPYRSASQSAAVSVTQALHRVPVASAVGGIPEQIDHGLDGMLVPRNASVEAWREVLADLTEEKRKMIGDAGARRVDRNHEAFRRGVLALLSR